MTFKAYQISNDTVTCRSISLMVATRSDFIAYCHVLDDCKSMQIAIFIPKCIY